MKIKLALFLFVFALMGCASTQTATRQTPTVMIHTSNLDVIKSKIVDLLASRNFVLVKDTPYMMEFQRQAQGIKENLIISLSIGNSYSTNYFTYNFMFARLPQGIKVTAIPGIKAIMPGGQVNTATLLNNNSVTQECEQLLQLIKSEVEDTTSTIPSSSATSHYQSY